jgi:hypothetical protein
MPSCPGKKDGHNCATIVYKCKACGNVGCEQSQQGKCTNQAFSGGRCLRCGKSGQRESFR